MRETRLDSMIPFIDTLRNIPEWQRRRILINQQYPRFVYKFRSISDEASVKIIEDILLRSQLWLSVPTAFNDPFDMCAKLIFAGSAKEKRNRIERMLKDQGISFSERERKRKKLMTKSNFPEMLRKSFQNQLSKIGVCSFAGDPRNILMWSHYADHHQGVCLQFDVVKDIDVFLGALKVNYPNSEAYPEINWAQEDHINSLGRAILTKHKGWAYEEERRIIRPRQANSLLNFNHSALTGIIFGCKCDKNRYQMILELLNQRLSSGKPQVRLYQTVMHDTEYRLRIKKVK